MNNGKRVRQIRVLKDWRLIDLQSKTGIHYSKLSLIENNLVEPTEREKGKIEVALSFPIDWDSEEEK